jgi:tRNA (guanine37-N1)-methyltransferase
MTMTEAIVRLLPDVIKEEQSRKDESYSTEMDMDNLEYPQYTRPDEVEGYGVPEVLLS